MKSSIQSGSLPCFFLSLWKHFTAWVHAHGNSPLSTIVMAVILWRILLSPKDGVWTTLSPARLSQFYKLQVWSAYSTGGEKNPTKLFKKHSCCHTAALMQAQQSEETILFCGRSFLPPIVTPPPPPVRHWEPCHGLYRARKWGPTANRPQLLQQAVYRLVRRIKSLHDPAALPANAVARKHF